MLVMQLCLALFMMDPQTSMGPPYGREAPPPPPKIEHSSPGKSPPPRSVAPFLALFGGTSYSPQTDTHLAYIPAPYAALVRVSW